MQVRHLLKEESLPSTYRYLYVDYGQFEAGILAGITNNQELIKLYEDDNVYKQLEEMSKSEDRHGKNCLLLLCIWLDNMEGSTIFFF